MKIAAIGDIHGCIDELEQLYKNLCYHSLDEIIVIGDMVDRGPDSGAVIDFCMRHKLRAIQGNHEQTILQIWDRYQRGDSIKNADKIKTCSQLDQTKIDWIKSLPYMHAYEPVNLVCVHGGMWPEIELWQQPTNIVRAQMVNPQKIGSSRWWGPDAIKLGHTEEEHRANGFERWYRIYDGPWNVVYGHSVFQQPHIKQNPGAGMTIGIDAGSCFGGSLTALIWDGKEPTFLSVKARKNYADLKRFSLEEE